MITAMTVVAIMILRALSLDSWMPSRFCRKKYSVTTQAMSTAPQLDRVTGVAWS